MAPIIEVTELTKEYRLGTVTSIKDTIRYTLAKFTGKETWTREKFEAVSDLNLSIEEGEVVGIIGQNGAGKSTLLKHLAHITNPTRGQVNIRGSVAPLIEVGAGLNPELTGRENIFLNAAILGIPKSVVKEKLEEIIEFAELSRFIDTPVKRYSSGMTVKLGFSIATSVNADILIIDEVLAVGDLAFQRKCFDRMESLIRNKGSTVLLVSHNIRQVERICSRVILMDQGKIIADGPANDICSQFYAMSNKKIARDKAVARNHDARINSTGEMELLEISVLGPDGHAVEEVPSMADLRIRVRFKLNTPLKQPEIIIGTHTTDFFYLSAGSTLEFGDRPNFQPGEHQIDYVAESFPMAAGVYAIRLSVFDHNRRALFIGESLKTFNVIQSSTKSDLGGWWSLNLSSRWVLQGKEYHAAETMFG